MKIVPQAKGTDRLFKNQLMEKLTRTHIAIPLTIFVSIAIGLLIYGFHHSYLTVLNTPFIFLVGFLAFTLVEYLIHRFIFHMRPTNKKREKLSYMIHGVHHHYPKDKDRLAMPIPLSIVLATLFFLFFELFMGTYVFAFLPGFLFGYTTYLWVHYMIHAFQLPSNFLKILWIHHNTHHYKDSDNAFGVSSPLWDVVFGTMPRNKE